MAQLAKIPTSIRCHPVVPKAMANAFELRADWEQFETMMLYRASKTAAHSEVCALLGGGRFELFGASPRHEAGLGIRGRTWVGEPCLGDVGPAIAGS